MSGIIFCRLIWLSGLVQVLDIGPGPKPPGIVNLLDVAHLWFRGHIAGRIVVVVEEETPSLLCEEDLNLCIIHPVGVLKSGKVGSDQLGLVGKRQGRPVVIKGIDIEVAADESPILVIEFRDRCIFSTVLA